MDPLSIATGAASLAATASTLLVWMNKLIKDIKNVDTKLTALVREMTTLTGLLTAVESTVRKCYSQSLTLAHLDENMWQRMDDIIVDCKIALEGLDRVLSKIQEPKSQTLMKVLKKPSLHFKLNNRMDDISDFMNKVYKLNCALQTSIAVVNISLSFRANTSQDLMFRKLKSLESRVEEALIASRRTEYDADPFASRLTRNLHGLAKAAQEFHYAASSTASTRYEAGDQRSSSTRRSSWGGSDFGRLTDYQQDRIDKWNNEMGALEEVQEEDVLSNGELSSTDPSTVITIPDLDDRTDKSHRARKEVRENENEYGDEESDDDGSDIELDFLKNFDELACSSFLRKDYSKAEQFLRKAMERNTGESSNGEHFKLLRIRLAICCCLQERWELAAGALSALSKSRAPSNLPVFDLLQAISLGYLANDRFDDAYRVCKSALQGKKKVVGKDSDNFHECLWILAMIYEKRGDPLEAEAVRLSIPAERIPQESTMSGKDYILEHPTLIKSAFGGNEKEKGPTDEPKNESTEATRSNETYIEPDRWEDLVPRAAVDGTSRAEKDERSKAHIGVTDTGKIFLLQSTGAENLIPRRGTGLGISKAISDEYSGKQIGEFDSGKEVAADTGEAIGTAKNGVPSPNIVKPGSAGQDSPRKTRAGPKKDLWYALYGKWHWEDLVLHHNSEQGSEENRSPDWYSTLEVVVDGVNKDHNEEAHIRVELAGNSDASNLRLRTEEQSGAKMLTSETSREDVVSPDSKDSTRIPWGIERAIDVRAQSSWRSRLSLPLDRTAVDRASSNFYIGVNLNLGDASFAMSGEQVPLCDSVIPHFKDLSSTPQAPSSDDCKDVWTDYPWNFLRMLLVHDERDNTIHKTVLFPSQLVPTECPDWMDNFDAAVATCSHLEDLETTIARWADGTVGKHFVPAKVQSIGVSVSDTVFTRAGKVLSYRLGHNPLFRHARLMPSSLAIAYYHFKSKSLSLEPWKNHRELARTLVVLNCDEVLVECTSYSAKNINDKFVELMPMGLTAAELCGSLHVEMEFGRIALSRLMLLMTRFKVKLTDAVIKTATKSFREEFRKRILPSFINDGSDWSVFANLPGPLRATERKLVFSNDDILKCFQPSMRCIRRMLIGPIVNFHDTGHLISHVLLAGQYASSKFLCRELRSAVTDLGMGTTLLGPEGCAFAATYGTLSFLDDSEILESLWEGGSRLRQDFTIVGRKYQPIFEYEGLHRWTWKI